MGGERDKVGDRASAPGQSFTASPITQRKCYFCKTTEIWSLILKSTFLAHFGTSKSCLGLCLLKANWV